MSWVSNGVSTVSRLNGQSKPDPAGPIKRLRMGKERVSGSRADHTSLARQDYCTSTKLFPFPRYCDLSHSLIRKLLIHCTIRYNLGHRAGEYYSDLFGHSIRLPPNLRIQGEPLFLRCNRVQPLPNRLQMTRSLPGQFVVSQPQTNQVSTVWEGHLFCAHRLLYQRTHICSGLSRNASRA